MPGMRLEMAPGRCGDVPLTIKELETAREKLREVKTVVKSQLRSVEADLCEVEIALSEMRAQDRKAKG